MDVKRWLLPRKASVFREAIAVWNTSNDLMGKCTHETDFFLMDITILSYNSCKTKQIFFFPDST